MGKLYAIKIRAELNLDADLAEQIIQILNR